MLSPPFLFPFTDELCSVSPVPTPVADSPPTFAVTPDGVAHVLVDDGLSVCWWAVAEDGDSALRAVWPLPGAHPVSIATTASGQIVMVGVTSEGWGLTTSRDGRLFRDLAIPARGLLRRMQVDADGTFLRLAFETDDGDIQFLRLDLMSGGVVQLGSNDTFIGGAHVAQ